MATKFTAEFLEARMAAHKIWQEEALDALIEIVRAEERSVPHPVKKPPPGKVSNARVWSEKLLFGREMELLH